MKKNKLLLIGGEGYIGLVIKKSLTKKGYKVHTLDNLIYSKEVKSKKDNFIYGDIRDSNKLSDVIEYADLVHSISRKKIYDKLLTIQHGKSKNILLQLKLGEEE